MQSTHAKLSLWDLTENEYWENDVLLKKEQQKNSMLKSKVLVVQKKASANTNLLKAMENITQRDDQTVDNHNKSGQQ